MNKTSLMESQTKEKAADKAMKRVREEKTRKKDDKSVDHVMKVIDSLGTTEEKLDSMCKKYVEMFNDHRLLQTTVKQAEKKNTLLQKEKEQLQAEHSKAILTRSRLENLCRELQRQNKAVKEECMLKMREEGEKKREVAAKFHSMLSEIGSLLAQNSDKNAKLRDDNLDMSMRLKSVCDQFEKKEQHVENLAKQMQLEMQLADAKLAKAKMEMDIEKETLQKEKQQLLIELADYKRKLCEMKASDIALREQITLYSEKYEEFHKALLQSNSAIGDFKAEMERMTKHISRLEKETATWKSRYDAAQRTLGDVTEGKIRSEESLALAQRRLIALQGICRGLQDQCRQLRGDKKDDLQTEEDYERLQAQIKEVERSAIDLDSSPCPRRVSCERTLEGESDVDRNSKSKEVSVIVRPQESIMQKAESENKSTSPIKGSQETNSEDNVTKDSQIEVIQENGNLKHEEDNTLKIDDSQDENSSFNSLADVNLLEKVLKNFDGLGNIYTLVPCDVQHTVAKNNECKLEETVNCKIKVSEVENVIQNVPTETFELKETVEINVPNSLSDGLNGLSLSDEHPKDIEISVSDTVSGNSILRDDALPTERTNHINGDTATNNLKICCNDKSDNHPEGNPSYIVNNQEDVVQSKSKKKRKMRK